jgi:hypothetical protein
MVSRGCGNSSVKEKRQKAGSIVRKYQKQGRHRRFFNLLLFAPAVAQKIVLKIFSRRTCAQGIIP